MKNLIFDLDGTLLDTLADLAGACNAVLKKHSFPKHPLAAYKNMVGNGFAKLVRRAIPQGAGEEEASALTAEAKAWYAEHLYDKTAPYPGVTEALLGLAEAGKGLAVLSNKPDAMTKEIISHFFPGIPFAAVQGAVPELPLKPAPDSLLNILSRFSWNPKESCYIGDSDVDIRTGKAAGLKTAGACWGFRGRDELMAEGPDFLLASPGMLFPALGRD